MTHREIPRFSRGYVTIHVTKLRGVASRFTALFYVGSFAFPFDLSSQAEDKTTEIRTGLMTGFVPTFHRAGAQNAAVSVSRMEALSASTKRCGYKYSSDTTQKFTARNDGVQAYIR